MSTRFCFRFKKSIKYCTVIKWEQNLIERIDKTGSSGLIKINIKLEGLRRWFNSRAHTPPMQTIHPAYLILLLLNIVLCIRDIMDFHIWCLEMELVISIYGGLNIGCN